MRQDTRCIPSFTGILAIFYGSNTPDKRSEAHWAQPCVRVGTFTGTGADRTDDKYAYLAKSFMFLDGKLAGMPSRDWAKEARYTPGQVWAGPGVPRADVNPRPLHPDVPSNGLIGCFSEDDSMIFAIAFEPYQELFQGVIRCLHSDFRLGGLEPEETLEINIIVLISSIGSYRKKQNYFESQCYALLSSTITKTIIYQNSFKLLFRYFCILILSI